MGPTSIEAEYEIATIRCLVAQQIHALDRADGDAVARGTADRLLRRLLRHAEAQRRRPASGPHRAG